MPHASTWFPSNSPSDPTNTNNDTTTTSTLANTRNKNKHTNNTTNSEVPPSPTSSEDLAVASERISIKCPLTLLTMKDPVTSQKCPHSFEKEAILGMIAASDVYVGGNGGGRRGGGQKAMKCPVCEVVSSPFFPSPSSSPFSFIPRVNQPVLKSSPFPPTAPHGLRSPSKPNPRPKDQTHTSRRPERPERRPYLLLPLLRR